MDWTSVVVSLIAAVGAVVSAWLAYLSHRRERGPDEWD